jgi:hypothetical protein
MRLDGLKPLNKCDSSREGKELPPTWNGRQSVRMGGRCLCVSCIEGQDLPKTHICRSHNDAIVVEAETQTKYIYARNRKSSHNICIRTEIALREQLPPIQSDSVLTLRLFCKPPDHLSAPISLPPCSSPLKHEQAASVNVAQSHPITSVNPSRHGLSSLLAKFDHLPKWLGSMLARSPIPHPTHGWFRHTP